MKILGIDFETTGLLDDPDTQAIEVGAILWDWETGPLVTYSDLIWPNGLKKVSDLTTELTGISLDHLANYGVSTRQAFDRIDSLMKQADFVMAHNAPFDKGVYSLEKKHLGTDEVDKVWIDTLQDIDYPSYCQNKKLKYLAMDHGVRLPEILLHRACFDVALMLAVASNYDLDLMAFSAKQPTIACAAEVTYDTKDIARKAGFRWYPDEKLWVKYVKEHKLKELEQTTPCGIRVLKHWDK